MAGIYLHIPFCKTRCIYCDFYSTTRSELKTHYVHTLCRELEMRKEYLKGEPVETIYFGGGTPSQLEEADFKHIFETIRENYGMEHCREITLEANPDDLSQEYLKMLSSLPFNRISMGVQSFKAEDLRFLNRRHDREQALRAVELCKENGLANISIDLIYGLPGQTLKEWESNLDRAIQLDIPHISAYHLIYEEGTALYKLKEAGKISPVEEEISVSLFTSLIDRLTANGYLHYEISNFARPGMISRHNSSYWTGKKYLGAGPSAHSYNGESRQWNVSSLPAYIRAIGNGSPEIEVEELDINTRYNDFIITGLRTMWGVNLTEIQGQFGNDKLIYCQKQAAPHLKQGLLIEKGETLILSRNGIFISDSIMSDLLWV